jgi:hypothetical protein
MNRIGLAAYLSTLRNVIREITVDGTIITTAVIVMFGNALLFALAAEIAGVLP